MSKSKWEYIGVQDYLQRLGLLKQGDPTAIAEAKRIYRSKYRIFHRKERQKTHPEFVIRFPKVLAEQIRRKAQSEDISAQKYMENIISQEMGVEVFEVSPITAQAQLTLSLIYTEIQDYLRNYHTSKNSQELFEKLLDRVEALEELLNMKVLL